MNLQSLATEMFRCYTESASNTLNEVFQLNPKSTYSLKNRKTFPTRPIHTVHYESNLLIYIGLNIWEVVANEAKNLKNVKPLKFVTKCWLPENCPCRLCKRYVYQVLNFFILVMFALAHFLLFLRK